MITCSVCGKENDNLAAVCGSCKSYLQPRVDTLDLFSTIWKLIESPGAAFKRIVLAVHKNYAVFLSCLLGIGLTYTIFWYKNLGPAFGDLVTLLGMGLLVGPVLGVVFVLSFSTLMHSMGRLFGGKATLRNVFAVVSYAGVPVVLSLVFVFPIEIAAFGLEFFGRNPHPMVLKPVVYVALIGFDVCAFIWSWVLLIEGTIVAHSLTRGRTAWVTLLAMLLTGCGALALYFV